jgi:endoglucanase
VTTLASSSLSAAEYAVSGQRIFQDGVEVQLFGVNWFGAETQDHVVHGLWTRNYQDMIDQMGGLGLNAVRLPVCPATLEDVVPSSINYGANPSLQGMRSLEVFDQVVGALDAAGIHILIDHHRPDCDAISELPAIPGYTQADWIEDLVFVVTRYRDVEYFMGIDLKNEPHGQATWGTGNATTDWDLAAETAAAAVLAANPDVLIFVEGVAQNPVCSSSGPHWWGGNLEPEACAPLDIPADRLVFSPHVYGPDVFEQPYFDEPTFPENLPGIWTTHFGFLADQGRILAPGEFGGRYGHAGDPRDVVWQDRLVDYFIEKQICHFFYWSWNPNSGDTGGLLQDDWSTVWQDKTDNLGRLMSACETARGEPASVPLFPPGGVGCLAVLLIGAGASTLRSEGWGPRRRE